MLAVLLLLLLPIFATEEPDDVLNSLLRIVTPDKCNDSESDYHHYQRCITSLVELQEILNCSKSAMLFQILNYRAILDNISDVSICVDSISCSTVIAFKYILNGLEFIGTQLLGSYNCVTSGLKIEQEKAITEALLRLFFLFFARNPIYITILVGIFILHVTYHVLIFPSSSWNLRNTLFGISTISLFACFSTTFVTRNEMTRFFDSPLDIRNNRASLQRTSTIALQSVFGLALILLSTQMHFTRHYSPYDIVLVILCIALTTRLIVVIIVWTNCIFRFGEKLHELTKFLEKCNGRTEYEHLALKLKDITLCLRVLNKKVSTTLLLAMILTTYCLLLALKNILSLTSFVVLTSPFVLLYIVCSYANVKLEKLKTASLRLFDLQFITPAINSLVNYFWMARKIEELSAIQVKFLFETTFGNMAKIVFYCFVVYISFEHCITSALQCKTF